MPVYNYQRKIVSPIYLEGLREKFYPLEYESPRYYSNNSRYKTLRRIKDKETGRLYHETWNQKYIDESNQDTYFTVTLQEENRLDLIANVFYGTPHFWWVLAAANYIIDPFDVPVGTISRIPPIASLYNRGGLLSGN